MNNNAKPCILAVDDENVNLKILAKHLQGDDYDVETAINGELALDMLFKSPEKYSTVLLDRMMPVMDGLEVLKRMKEDPTLKEVPVIFQTSLNDDDDVTEGLAAGAYYYLTKPIRKKILAAVVKSAVFEFTQHKKLRSQSERTIDAIHFLRKGHFEVKTMDQGEKLSALLSSFTENPSKIVIGLWELIANGIEHGNLGITYAEKSQLNEDNTWHAEIQKRLAMPENSEKTLKVEYEHFDDRIAFTIKDHGDGFDWESYLELNPERAFDNHGRGIAMAGMYSFDALTYQGSGNEVIAEINLPIK